MKSIRITWVGCHEEGIPAFRRLLEQGKRIVRFITLSEASFANRSAGSRGYGELCEAHGVPVSMVDTIKGEEAFELLRADAPDLLVVMGWSEILPDRLLQIPAIGTVGTHAAMLPHNRGSAPINWALIRGETSAGNSMMWLNAQVDEGDIIDQMPFDITPYDTCKTLYDKVAQTNEAMLCRLVEQLEAGTVPARTLENATEEPLLPRRRPADGLLRWDTPAQAVYDFIRALTRPYPGAFTTLAGRKLFVWRASLLPLAVPRAEPPGTLLGSVYSPDPACCGLLVACAEGCVILHEIEDEEHRIYEGPDLSGGGFAGRFA